MRIMILMQSFCERTAILIEKQIESWKSFSLMVTKILIPNFKQTAAFEFQSNWCTG